MRHSKQTSSVLIDPVHIYRTHMYKHLISNCNVYVKYVVKAQHPLRLSIKDLASMHIIGRQHNMDMLGQMDLINFYGISKSTCLAAVLL